MMYIWINKKVADYYPYKTVEYVDGAKGDEGGISYLRSGKDADLTTLAYAKDLPRDQLAGVGIYVGIGPFELC